MTKHLVSRLNYTAFLIDFMELCFDFFLPSSIPHPYREIEDGPVGELREWAKNHKELFPAPTTHEAKFILEIFKHQHFQQNIERKKILKGGKNADPFIIARAKVLNATVVTLESEPPNAAKIPNICRLFDISCISLEDFMEREKWEF